ncbi:molecular chaperone HscB [Fusarium austroafricanum]|uniref:Molecular chaperone HscB n=1 Tax=Fusarium austroafricanum TaxID=2364996 RepID=A0A8H4KAG9_9HYPO|nr:molecular chaperone HscB [Fusarium austroafricanum]
MRTSAVSPYVRDLSRLCIRCQLRVRRASTLTSSHRTSVAATSIRHHVALAAAVRGPVTTFNHVRSASSAAQPEPQPSPSSGAPPSTHYDLFPETLPDGPPPAGHFPIDTRALRREFLRLQARAHPDMHPAQDKARAEAMSALINEAYKTLSNPLLRAQYLLSLRGVDVANDETLKVEEPELLMLVLEAREEIEDAEHEEDLDEPRAANDARIAESEQILERAFQHDDIKAAKHEAVRLRYWVNIKESLDNWERGKQVVLQH